MARHHLTPEEFSAEFSQSELGRKARSEVEMPLTSGTQNLDEERRAYLTKWISQKYRNSWFESLKLLVQRETLLWWRDKYEIRSRIIQGKFCASKIIVFKMGAQSHNHFSRLDNGHRCWNSILAR